jgi:hypothetical protein
LTHRNFETISFNLLLLQQIEKDGNLHHAFNTIKGGKGNYFDYLVEKVLPLHFNPKEYQFGTGRNLMLKFNNFIKHCDRIERTMHSTDATGSEGECVDSDVEMFIKLRTSDDVPVTKISKKNEAQKFRSVQAGLIGNQTPLFGNTNRSQVSNANKRDRNHNIENETVLTNLTPVATTIHRRQQSSQKKKILLLHPATSYVRD